MDSAQESDLAPIFGDLSPNEKLSEIKPPYLLIVPFLNFHLLLFQDFRNALSKGQRLCQITSHLHRRPFSAKSSFQFCAKNTLRRRQR